MAPGAAVAVVGDIAVAVVVAGDTALLLWWRMIL